MECNLQRNITSSHATLLLCLVLIIITLLNYSDMCKTLSYDCMASVRTACLTHTHTNTCIGSVAWLNPAHPGLSFDPRTHTHTHMSPPLESWDTRQCVSSALGNKCKAARHLIQRQTSVWRVHRSNPVLLVSGHSLSDHRDWMSDFCKIYIC